MEAVLTVVLLAAVAWLVTAPFRGADGTEGGAEPTEDPRIAELEARKESLYRQIRDAELDRAQGKLSEADWKRADAELRRDAIEVLKALDRARSAAEARAVQAQRALD